jgi:hypothetical protein
MGCEVKRYLPLGNMTRDRSTPGRKESAMEWRLTLDDEDLTAINEGLQEVKLRLSAPVIAKINRQIAEQKADQQERPQDEPGR